ncbi:methionine--tRNA ligase [Candidatus Similichlamydia laticola]|uniref:Methionine--tRNA ligase n=1 Tax=Candidatus Similichlamydia laticola TaxID=2170265 RepID=A0A369KFD9_9BACT|nr:methionine--tRNA ligase [Candidatus Similichlamydia laticola]RDB31415.1 Methionyl-tRNA synthetase [Candidatus Similichlamydia laticola]
MTEKKVLVTAALPYANGTLHFGHMAGVYLPADVFSRFCRFRGDDVLFISGSDEYGLAVSISAELAGRTPKEHAQIYHVFNKRLLDRFLISMDHFSRTTNPYHAELVSSFFLKLVENGFIEATTGDHLYSPKEERFLADRYVQGRCPLCGFQEARGDECTKCGSSYEATSLLNPVSKINGERLEKRASTHYFLRLDALQEQIKKWLQKKEEWKPSVMNFLLSSVDELRPRAITRDTSWGVPVPNCPQFSDHNFSQKVFYVWFDAPLGYISASIEWAVQQGDESLWRTFWEDQNVRYIQFLGKDNVTFHGLMFPGMLLGEGGSYKMVDSLQVNQFYTMEGQKISKTDGVHVDLEAVLDRYDVEQLRYMFASTAPELSDSDFRWKDFQNKCNTDLVGKLGNFVNRTLTIVHRECGGLVPEVYGFAEEDELALGKAKVLLEEMSECYDTCRLRRATQVLMECAHVANAYFDTAQPWKLIEDSHQTTRLHTVLFCCLEFIRLLAIGSYPLLPEAAEKMWAMVGGSGSLGEKTWKERAEQSVFTGSKCAASQILFKKVADEQIEAELDQMTSDTDPIEKREMVTLEEFQRLDLRVGKILEANLVPRSSKLILLRVDLGTEIVPILSGIAQHCSPESLLQKKVVVLTNLKPIRLMGIESKGMILAMDLEGSGIELLTVCEAAVGSKVQ